MKVPTPEMLAGIYLQVVGDEDLTVVPCCPPEPADPGADAVVPTIEDLTGHYLFAEGVEDLTKHPGLWVDGADSGPQPRSTPA